MSYVIGVDLGTTFSAAAVGRGDRVEIFDLGTRHAAIPSVVTLRVDGTVLVGEAAERRSVTEATRTAREFKRRLGDPTPFLLGGTPYGAEALTGHLLADIVRRISDQLDGSPQRVILTHPANYGDYKRGYLEEAARLAGLGDVEFVPEPVAAAVHYAAGERLSTGELLAVYDFGGGTLDIAAVRATGNGFELVGTPEGMERFGGVDLDEAVFFHVRNSLGEAMAELDPLDATVTSALAALRVACREAKEALSADTDTTIPVMLPTIHTEVRLTRAEFEDMLRPRLRETMTVLNRVIASAGASYAEVSRVLLVGGASRTPLVAEMIRQETGRPVAVDANPKYAVSMGAARLALTDAATDSAAADPAPEPDTGESDGETEQERAPEPREDPVDSIEEPISEPPEPDPLDEEPPTETDTTAQPSPKPESPPPVQSSDRRRSRWIAALLTLLAVAAVVVAAFAVFGGDDEPVASEPSTDGTTQIVEDELGPTPFGLMYFTQFRNPEPDGEWGLWGVAETEPPDDIASDYFPELGPYSSNDPFILDRHMEWIGSTGADLLVVNWPGAAAGNDGLLEGVLERAEQSGLAVIPLIEPYPERSPDSVAADIEQLSVRFGDHPAWFRSHRNSPWTDDAGRTVVMVASPELMNERPELGPGDWLGATDAAHSLGALILAVGTDPAWIEGGRFDGLVGGSVDGSFGWSADLGDLAWFVPMVTPGRSTERLGEPDQMQERAEGAFFEQQWMAIAASSRTADLVVVVSFNGWTDGTQIEPASPTPPDPRYRTYAPLEPNTYLELTRELAERVLGPRG